ncbi:MAG: tetratricopeptide repeat protein [Gammaproteobacteria bacterium]
MTDATGLLTLLLVLTMTGCATTESPAPVEDIGGGAAHRSEAPAAAATQADGVEVFPAQSAPLTQQSMPQPLEARPAPQAAAPPRPQSPAVVALLDNADRQAGSGNLDSAAAALERALRIEPRNASLWQRLADIRLRQKQPDQAESLALKSNTLAVGDAATQAGNWRIIAKARRSRGDAAGAAQAENRAVALAR